MRATRLCIPLFALLTACSDPGSRSAAQPALPEATRRPPADAGAMKMSFGPVVRRAAPAVVNISAKRVVRAQADPFWQLFGGGMPRERVEGSLGSGVIVRSDGVIVTNNHVVENGQEITVSLADRREFPARVLLTDPRTDLAVLKIDATGLPVLPIDNGEDLQVGDLVLAIGDPFGVGQTVTNGIISALDRTEVGQGTASSYIQTDAAINPGNSGGALVDMDGDLIGVNSFILSRSGTSSGVGFAVPGRVVRQVVETAFGGGRSVVRPWLGVRGQGVTSEIAASLGLPRPEGVLISGVYPGSSAARAGLRDGDVVLSVDGVAVNDEGGLNYRTSTQRVGDTVTLQVRQGGQTRPVRVRLEAARTEARDQRTLSGPHPLDGATVLNLSPGVATELGLDPFASGVLITAMSPRGLVARTGMRPGDLIRAVNGREISTVGQLQGALGQTRQWQLVVERGGQRVTLQFSL
jgi:Do/DeqQ family serine protease